MSRQWFERYLSERQRNIKQVSLVISRFIWKLLNPHFRSKLGRTFFSPFWGGFPLLYCLQTVKAANNKITKIGLNSYFYTHNSVTFSFRYLNKRLNWFFILNANYLKTTSRNNALRYGNLNSITQKWIWNKLTHLSPSKYVSHSRWQVALVLHDLCTNNDGLLIHAFSREKNGTYLKMTKLLPCLLLLLYFSNGPLKMLNM